MIDITKAVDAVKGLESLGLIARSDWCTPKIISKQHRSKVIKKAYDNAARIGANSRAK